MNDTEFVSHVADRLAGLPRVDAVALGGSRAIGTARPDSDWDFGLYYRGAFDPESVRGLGWEGHVSDIGGWGGGAFNGGAWLTVADRRVDLHYRDLDVIDREIAEAEAGRVHIEPLMFHLVGIPTYLLVAELANNATLHGSLPSIDYPPALAVQAPKTWTGLADAQFDYAARFFAARNEVSATAGMLAVAATAYAHAVLAARREWVTNEKGLLERAGLHEVDEVIASLSTRPLARSVRRVWTACGETLTAAQSI